MDDPRFRGLLGCSEKPRGPVALRVVPHPESPSRMPNGHAYTIRHTSRLREDEWDAFRRGPPERPRAAQFTVEGERSRVLDSNRSGLACSKNCRTYVSAAALSA